MSEYFASDTLNPKQTKTKENQKKTQKTNKHTNTQTAIFQEVYSKSVS